MTKDEAIKILRAMWKYEECGYSEQGIREALTTAIKALEQEPPTGHWITNPKCSECGGEPYFSNSIYNYKFCPYCGAKMESEE